ncbi:hypothetical protein HDU91_001539 [Kappamyces sp. JEL0680]|nr:hypothetical protein HDU91_001539 [Kappamyces sp. JEL0680]
MDTVPQLLVKEEGDTSATEYSATVPSPVHIPDGGADAWLAVLASFLVHVVVIGIPTTFGVFQAQYRSDLTTYEGSHSTLSIAFIGSISNSGLGLFSIPSGRLAEIFGHRQMCAIGGVLVMASLLLASISTQYWQLVLTQGVMFGVSCAVAYFPALTIISHYFSKRKGLATGIAVSGSGLGGLAISPLTHTLIDGLGTRGALRVLGIAGGAIVIFAAWFLKPRLDPSPRGQLDYLAIIRSSRFVRLFLTALLCSLGYFIPFFFLPTFAHYYGMSAATGALCIGLMNGASGLGRIALGFNADILGHINTLWVCLTLSSLWVLLLWPWSTSLGLLIAFSVLYGFCIGGFISLLPTAIVTLFGTKDLATKTGLVYSGFFFGNLLGAPLGGILLDSLTTTSAEGSTTILFWPTQILCGGFILMASIVLLSTKLSIGKGRFAVKV